jgi:hypothetical protein
MSHQYTKRIEIDLSKFIFFNDADEKEFIDELNGVYEKYMKELDEIIKNRQLEDERKCSICGDLIEDEQPFCMCGNVMYPGRLWDECEFFGFK